MGGSVFICDNNRIMFSVMGSQVFNHFKTLSFDLRACFIFQKFDKQLRCSVFTFVKYIKKTYKLQIYFIHSITDSQRVASILNL